LNSRKRQFELFVMLTMRHTINFLLYQQGILSPGKIITYSKLTLMHARAYNFNLSQIYSKLTNKEIKIWKHRNPNDFVLSPVNSDIFHKFPLNSLPLEWNQLG
jgi:hypothetical protein